MADQFDIVDIVYNAVEPASMGFILYKDQSGDGEKRNHITIRSLALIHLSSLHIPDQESGSSGQTWLPRGFRHG